MPFRRFAVAIVAVGLLACSSKSNQPLTLGLSVTVNGSGGGVVTSSPAGIQCGSACTASLDRGTLVTLTATADANSFFSGWAGACAGTNATCQVTMGSAQSVIATFSRNTPSQRTLQVTIGGNAVGSSEVHASPTDLGCSGNSCSQVYGDGTAVTITATPDTTDFPGATVTFTGCDQSTATTCSVAMNGDKNVSVVFSYTPTHTLTVNLGGGAGGVVAALGLSCSGTVCTGIYNEGSAITLTATPDTGDFPGATVSFAGPCNVSGNACVATMSGDLTVNVTFNLPVQHALTISVTGDGTVSSDVGGIFCSSAGEATCSAQVSDGTTVHLFTDGTNPQILWSTISGPGCSMASPVACAVDMSGDTTVGAAITQEVGGLTVAAALQSAHLTWGNPDVPNFQGTTVWVSTPGGTATQVGTTSSAQNSFDVVGLYPGLHYAFTVVSSDGSVSGQTQSATTVFSGDSNQDWPATDGATTYHQADVSKVGSNVFFTWSGSALFFGFKHVSNPLLSAGTAVWVALDTDPTLDNLGSTANTMVGQNAVIWPFRANYLAELRLDDSGSPTATLYDAVSGNPINSASGTDGVHSSSIDEISVSRQDLGSPSQVRFAMVAFDTSNGFTFDLAPESVHANDVLGFHPSLAGSYAAGSATFDISHTKTSAQDSPHDEAADLVVLQVFDGSIPAGRVIRVNSSTPPFSPNPTDSDYALSDDGLFGDGAANDGVFTGRFNLGESAGAFYFQFAEFETSTGTWTTETGYSLFHDRLHQLTGASESIPEAAFGTPYDVVQGLTVNFEVHSNKAPAFITGDVQELGDWCASGESMLALTDTGSQDANGLEIFTASVAISGSHLPGGFPSNSLQWKVIYAGGAPGACWVDASHDYWEHPLGDANHELTHDLFDPVMGTPTLDATFQDGVFGPGEPF